MGDEITIKVGLGGGIDWLNQPGELIAERNIVLAAFTARSETSIEFRIGRARFRPCDDPLQRLEAIIADRAGNKTVPIEAGPEIGLSAGLHSFRDDVFEVSIARADGHAAFYLKAEPIALASGGTVRDHVVHGLTLPVLLDRHARHDPWLRERGFLPEQRGKEIGADDILVGETFAAGKLRGPGAVFLVCQSDPLLAATNRRLANGPARGSDVLGSATNF